MKSIFMISGCQEFFHFPLKIKQYQMNNNTEYTFTNIEFMKIKQLNEWKNIMSRFYIEFRGLWWKVYLILNAFLSMQTKKYTFSTTENEHDEFMGFHVAKDNLQFKLTVFERKVYFFSFVLYNIRKSGALCIWKDK